MPFRIYQLYLVAYTYNILSESILNVETSLFLAYSLIPQTLSRQIDENNNNNKNDGLLAFVF